MKNKGGENSNKQKPSTGKSIFWCFERSQ